MKANTYTINLRFRKMYYKYYTRAKTNIGMNTTYAHIFSNH